MDPGEQVTGTRDEHYNLISVLYHALHGAENCEIYVFDAETTGRGELAAFFREAQAMHAALAEQAKGHLGIGGTTPGDITEGATLGGGTPTGEVPPRTAQSGWESAPPRPRRTSPGETAPPSEDLLAETGSVAPTAPAEDEDAARPAEAPRRGAPPDAPRTQEPPPRTGDAPPSPSEQPPR